MTFKTWLAIGFFCFLLRWHHRERGYSYCVRCERDL